MKQFKRLIEVVSELDEEEKDDELMMAAWKLEAMIFIAEGDLNKAEDCINAIKMLRLSEIESSEK